MGVTGIELQWDPSTDNNWISYYQIYRDGDPISRVAKGRYYFDHSRGTENPTAAYEVQAVDGDGNRSRKIKATEVSGGTKLYTAVGGYLSGKDYSYQGANGWSYPEWVSLTHTDLKWNGALGHMGLYIGSGSANHQGSTIGASWMLPGSVTDAVRVFEAPHTGVATVTGVIHKDIYHTYGDGVRARVLKNNEQVWPEAGWETIAATDTAGKTMTVKLALKRGDRLFFVLNRNGDSTDDNTVWNPQVAYERTDDDTNQTRLSWTDSNSSRLKYSEQGWQRLGQNPWNSDVDQGYLPGWMRGSVSVSTKPGASMSLQFHGTGIELVGDVGGDGGIAEIFLDGKLAAVIDTFEPSHVPSSIWNQPTKKIGHWPDAPPVCLWGIHGLLDGPHTLELRVTGQKNAESIGAAIGIDSVGVLNGSVDPHTED